MRGYIHSARPAGAAIAAVLALGSTYSFAQEMAAPEAASPTVVVPPVVTPSAPVSQPEATQPMVQPTASVEDRLNSAVAASQAEATAAGGAAERPAAPAQKRPSSRMASTPANANARTEPARSVPTPVAERAAQPVAVPESPLAAAPEMAAREAAPAAGVATQGDPVQADEARAGNNGTDQSLLWALGGGALLLAGIGGAAAVRRRRMRTEAGEVEMLLPVATATMAEPAYVAPPVMARAPVAEPAVHTAAMAAPVGAHASRLEAMVAAPPTPENPFRTHRKRLARARFLLAEREKREQLRPAVAPAAVPPQTIHAEPQMQTVYRMGADRNRRMSFKPQTR